MTLDGHTDATKLSVVLKKYIPSCKSVNDIGGFKKECVPDGTQILMTSDTACLIVAPNVIT
jgi:hypothetical protein